MKKSEDIPEVELPLLPSFSLLRLYDFDEDVDEELKDRDFSCIAERFVLFVSFSVCELKFAFLFLFDSISFNFFRVSTGAPNLDRVHSSPDEFSALFITNP